jgi:hypothetical protein
MSNETLSRERDENEKLRNKLFVIENAIVKKDNTILALKKRLDKISDNYEAKYLNYVEKEIIITEPTLAVNQMYDELILYKQIYENLINHVKDNKDSIMKYENLLNVIIY